MKKKKLKLKARPVGYLTLTGLMAIGVATSRTPEPEVMGPSAREALDEIAAGTEEAALELAALLGRGHNVGATTAGEAGWDIANIDHERVDYWIEQFQTDKKENFENFLRRMGRYEPMILEKLEERGMPSDLIYLAMIESGFQAKAYSSASASGIWQFIPETGQRYGLEINRAVDERNDPEKATDSALSYLSDLHDRFDSWYLASAAYNTGENRVGRIMREETGSEKGEEKDYYAIWDRLPRETRDYVPLMIAAARISKDPARYGFDHVVKDAPLTFDTIEVAPAAQLASIATRSGTTIAEIKRLNPQLKLDRTRNDQRSTLRVPVDAEAR